MNYYKSKLYYDEIKQILDCDESYKVLKDKVLVITGTRGLICSELIDTVMYANKQYNLNCKIYGIVRNVEAADERFAEYKECTNFQLIQGDINNDIIKINEDIDYFIHGASNTHPVFYSTKPIETILTNTVGTNNALEFAIKHHCKRFIFMSSVEIYGENRGDIEKFTEEYLGYINSNTLRAGYPESKRVGEALCQAYVHEKQLDCVIPRISRVYGPGLLKEDSKALSQFLNCAIEKRNITLKSRGNQKYSYIYAADVVSAILFLIANGKRGEAYNITDSESDITLAELAGYIASIAGTQVVYDIPAETEAAGYSKATKALLDISKIQELGWNSRYKIRDGIERTVEMQKMSRG